MSHQTLQPDTEMISMATDTSCTAQAAIDGAPVGKSILMINHFAVSPDEPSSSNRMFDLAQQWIKMGHRVTIVAARHHHLRCGNESPGGTSEREIDGIRFIYLRTPRSRGARFSRLLNFFGFVTQLFLNARKLVRSAKPDVVIAGSVFLLDTIPARWIARRSNAILVREIRDLWPLTLIEVGGVSPNHPFNRLIKWAEKYSYRHADHVVTTLANFEQYLHRERLHCRRVSYVPHGVDVESYDDRVIQPPEQYLRALDALKEKGQFIVGYFGSHGITNALHVLLQTAALMTERPVAFVLVGNGPEKEALRRDAAQLGLDNVHFLPPIPKSAVPAALAYVDACYIGWAKKPIYRFGISPNKLLDYMMAQKPVVHAVDAGNDLVADSGCGLSVPPDDPPAIAHAILQLQRMTPDQRVEMGRRGRDFVARHHDWRVLSRQYLAEVWDHQE